MKQLKCACLDGLDATSVDVEATFTKGLPSFSIVGLANNAIQESRDRIKSALLTNEFKFPPKKITINLSPSEISKSGSHFDLPIALLVALNSAKCDLSGYFVFGEVGLSGALKDTHSIFVLILSLSQQGLVKNVLIPKASVSKISKIPHINIYAVDTLSQACDFFKFDAKEQHRVNNVDFGCNSIKLGANRYYFNPTYDDDFLDVKGQNVAKRAALIAAAGNHNILLEGSPGCGKSMISKRMKYILPPMSLNEILQKAKLECLDAKEPSFTPVRVFRNPHHSSTKASIFGGGTSSAKIGEVALSHNGILFFDEVPHFSKTVLEALREPLEDYRLLISRVNSKIHYDTKFLFICALNPCPCGNLLSVSKVCRCSELEVKRYKNRLSEPFLDRIDLYVTMSEVKLTDKADVSSKDLHEKVLQAFAMQKNRKQKNLNGKLNDAELELFCPLDEACETVLNKAIMNLDLSFRSANKIKKVARTIADLDNQVHIQPKHLLESISYRKRS